MFCQIIAVCMIIDADNRLDNDTTAVKQFYFNRQYYTASV